MGALPKLVRTALALAAAKPLQQQQAVLGSRASVRGLRKPAVMFSVFFFFCDLLYFRIQDTRGSRANKARPFERTGKSIFEPRTHSVSQIDKRHSGRFYNSTTTNAYEHETPTRYCHTIAATATAVCEQLHTKYTRKV